MADSKITALASLTTADPANDMFPVVDVSDTSMAASGTTKRISINNILACSPSATLASATITGDLTVDTSTLKVDSTNNRVGIGTASPTVPLYVTGNNATATAIMQDETNGAKLRLLANSINFDITNGGGGGEIAVSGANPLTFKTNGTERARIDSSGNVGIGITPSAWNSGVKAIEFGSGNALFSSSSGYGQTYFVNNAFYNTSGNYVYKNTQAAGSYVQNQGAHQWLNAPSGTAGNAITFTQAMTLDDSGNLLVGTTTNTNVSRIFSRGTATSSALALQGASGDVALAQLTVGKFDNNTTTSQVFVRFTINDNSGGSGQINANGASQAAFGTFSDSRLKENILSLPSQLANILSLRPVEFDYKDGSGHQIGFVAQEMQEVYSDAVGEQNGFLTVTGWSKTEARLVSAIKELAAKVQALEAKLA